MVGGGSWYGGQILEGAAWRIVGRLHRATIIYADMLAVGMVNDRLVDWFRHAELNDA